MKPTAAVKVEPVPAQRTLASAIQIGAPVSARRALRALEALDGVVEQATEQELADAAARGDRAGLFTCPHTGVALAALEKLAARGAIRRGERVVVVSTAHGLKFSDFKVGYHDGTLPGIASPLRNPGVKLPGDARAPSRTRLPPASGGGRNGPRWRPRPRAEGPRCAPRASTTRSPRASRSAARSTASAAARTSGSPALIAIGLAVKLAWDRWGTLPPGAVRKIPTGPPLFFFLAAALAAALVAVTLRDLLRARRLMREEDALFARLVALRGALGLDH